MPRQWLPKFAKGSPARAGHYCFLNNAATKGQTLPGHTILHLFLVPNSRYFKFNKVDFGVRYSAFIIRY